MEALFAIAVIALMCLAIRAVIAYAGRRADMEDNIEERLARYGGRRI